MLTGLTISHIIRGFEYKNEEAVAGSDNVKKSLVVTLRIPYYRYHPRQLKRFGFAPPNTPIWPYKTLRFKLGHNPWAGLGFPKPSEAVVRQVHKHLSEYHAKFNFGTFVSIAPETEEVITIDNVIQIILAQNTSNENAIDTHSRLCNTFTYSVGGRKYAGKTPNWHEVRGSPIQQLEKALKPTGYHQRRAKIIKAVLDTVYVENVKRRADGLRSYSSCTNPSEAKDFVDGMLSMRYITEPSDLSTETILGRLLALPGIGPKSAMCIIAFRLKRPLFVVDTHVLRYTKWLGWIPPNCDDINLAAMYLHTIVPDDIKYDLHNQIWTHCARENTFGSGDRSVLCPFCGSLPPSKRMLKEMDIACPVEEFLPPLGQRWPKRLWKEIEVKGSQDMIDRVVVSEHFPGTSASSLKPSSKTWRLLRTMSFDDLTPEQAEAQGYLLWQFRPLDNSFGEEWGTFEAYPRFKWEKPDIMDPNVAVTYEYARDVLAGRAPHSWTRNM